MGDDDRLAGRDTDDDLWARLRHSDPEALTRLFQRHRRRLLAVARHRLVQHGGRPDEDEDVVAEVFLTVWRRREHLPSDRGAPVAWLLSAVDMVCRNVCRATSRARRLQLRLAATPPDATPPGPLDLAVADDQNRRWLVQLSALTPGEVPVAVLCLFQGRPAVEVARLLNLSEAAVRSRLHRARNTLRQTAGT